MKLITCLPLFVVALCCLVSAAPKEFIKLNLEERQERVQELNDEIKRLDASIERNIDRLEAQIRTSKDSADSGITVQQTKENLIQGLGKLASYYKEQRELLLTEAKRTMPRADTDSLNAIAQAYDQRIDKRINQILVLNQSLSAPDTSKGSDKQLARRADAQQAATVSAIEKTITSLNENNRVLEARLGSMNGRDASAIRDEMAANEERIQRREKQLADLKSGTQIAATPISKSEALQLRKLLEASAGDIKEDSYRLSNLIIEYLKEEEAVRQLKIELQSHQADPAKSEE